MKTKKTASAKPLSRGFVSACLAVSLVFVQIITFNGRDWSNYFQNVDEGKTNTATMMTNEHENNDMEPTTTSTNYASLSDFPVLTTTTNREQLAQPTPPHSSSLELEPHHDHDQSHIRRHLQVNDTFLRQKSHSTISSYDDIMSVLADAAHPNSPVVCTLSNNNRGRDYDNSNKTKDNVQCCGTWDVNADDWWLHKPDWEISFEDETKFCFSPIEDKTYANFMKQIHQRQWFGNCSHVEKSVEVNSGYGASMSWLKQAFWHAHKNNNPFQIVNCTRRWLYATENQSSWAYCDTEDTRCYWLPINNCSREETIRGQHASANPNGSRKEALEFHWLEKYLTRPRQHYRRKLYELRQTVPLSHPCTTMHVRRGDAGFPRPPFRRYAAVQEYIDAAHIQPGDSVFLMTDDVSTIEEIHRHLPGYNWIYLQRPRAQNVKGGFNGHIPSGDEGQELLAIDTELTLAKTCEKFVYGHSGFVKALIMELGLEGRNYTKYNVDTTVSKDEALKFGRDRDARVQSYLDDIEVLYQQRRADGNISISPVTNDESATKRGAQDQPLFVAPKQDSSALASDMTGNPVDMEDTSLKCYNGSGKVECCASWDTNSDIWWLHRPDWEVSLENETTYCFSPIANEDKAQMMREVHQMQWFTGNCSSVERTAEINSGFGADISWLLYSFWHAHGSYKPFQIARSDWHWMYAARNKSSWAYCADEDITCYILPVSPCSRDGFNKDERQWWKPKKSRPREIQLASWLREYMLRPRHIFRQKAFEMRQHVKLKYPCTTMHVRRADAGLPYPPYRRYAAVQEYIDAANLQKGENIFLLTDDSSTIEEAEKFHPDFNFIYLDRPRNHGVSGGWEGHIPSGMGEFEMLAINTELRLADTCSKIVYGDSGFMKAFLENIRAEGREVETYYVDTTVTKQDAQKFLTKPKERADSLLAAIESARNSTAYDEENDQDEKSNELVKEPPRSSFEEDDVPEGKYNNDNNRDSSVIGLPEVVNSLQCFNDSGGSTCCGSWDIDADSWWLHKPDWEVSLENETTYCFSPMENKEKASFFRTVHDLQWVSGNCSEAITTWHINSGFGATTGWLSYTFVKARQEKKPFQYMTRGPWLYGPKDNTSWAFCKERDSSCYYLPISACPRTKWPEKGRPERHWAMPAGHKEHIEYQWQKEYMRRPKQIMRRKLYEMRTKLNVQHPCTTMHVRRGDAGFPRQPYRRYAAVQEYLDAAQVEEGDNIFLLTDDNSTLEEIRVHHPNYNWIYLDRPRNKGVDGGWEGHIPSGDGAYEILVIETELRLASECDKVVHGNSGFMKVLRGKMDMEGKKYKAYYVQMGVPKVEALKWPQDGKERLEHFQRQMEEYRQKSREKKRGRK